MYCYPVVFQMASCPVVSASNVELVPNYVHMMENLQFFYNSEIIIPIKDFLPQGNLNQGNQKYQLQYNESEDTSRNSKNTHKIKYKNKQQSVEENYEPNNNCSNPLNSTQMLKKKRNNLSKQKSEELELWEEQEQLCLQDKNQMDQDCQAQANYPKKNTQSNIVNQIFSFVSTELKSHAIVKRYLQEDQKKVASFYQILKAIKKRKKKYINRKYLSTLCIIREQDVGYKMLLRARNRMSVLSVEEFQKVLSILIIYYLNNQSQISILTSKKINKSTFIEHLERRRQIKQFLIEKLQSSLNKRKSNQ